MGVDASVFDATAVIMMTVVSGEISLAARRTCSPSTFGILRSVMTTSTESRWSISMAASPPVAEETS